MGAQFRKPFIGFVYKADVRRVVFGSEKRNNPKPGSIVWRLSVKTT
jgi:hypothetical protein